MAESSDEEDLQCLPDQFDTKAELKQFKIKQSKLLKELFTKLHVRFNWQPIKEKVRNKTDAGKKGKDFESPHRLFEVLLDIDAIRRGNYYLID